MKSKIFQPMALSFSGGNELVLYGGRNLFPPLPQCFKGINQIGIIGWGSQGPAQAQNLRDTMKEIGSPIKVSVGLRSGSKAFDAAYKAGFTTEDASLGAMEEIIPKSDLVILLISDGAQTELWQSLTGLMKSGATLGLSHGFLLGHLKSIGASFRDDINVILMAPKGMGPSVRALYLQGKETNGAGINASVAVEQEYTEKAWDYALGWAVAVGSPAIFGTTMEQEVVSDLFGERAMLLGGLWGLVEYLYGHNCILGLTPEEAFLNSAKGLTSTVSQEISAHGLLGFYQQLERKQQREFLLGYTLSYKAAFRVMRTLYEEVRSWREIAAVVKATAELKNTPMSPLENSAMWTVGKGLYGREVPMNEHLAFGAGMYIGGIMAQMHTLDANGHSISEIVNESLIEAIDSLNPYVDARGINYMVSNCSWTAQIGTRTWGPRFRDEFQDEPRPSAEEVADAEKSFLTHPFHKDIELCFGLRPSVRVAVT